MGEKAVEIVKGDSKEIVEFLNKALADEWLAYYQYWVGSKVVKGRMRPNIEEELKEHADEELKHANMLAERIITLGGEPIVDFAKIKENANCGYEAPSNPESMEIVKQNIKGEQCAIEVYNKLLEKTKDVDALTYNMVLEILEDEVEHEEDLQGILEDLES